MSKKLKLFFVIVLIVSIIFLILFFFLRDLKLVWRIVYGSVGFIGSIASIVGLLKGGSETPPPPPANLHFTFTGTYIVNNIIIVNLKNNTPYSSADDVNVSLDRYDICRLDNKDDFPIKSLPTGGTFVVKLRRTVYGPTSVSKIIIDFKINNSRYSEVMEVDVDKIEKR